MQVSEVRLNLINTDNAVKAIGSFALDGAFAVRGVRVMEDKNGHNFVAFPSRAKADGSYEDLKQAQEQNQAQEASQEVTQTEGESEAKPTPKRGKGR